MRLRLGRFLHGSAGCRVEPCFDCLLSFHLRRCPVPALVGLGRQRVAAAFLDNRIDDGLCRIQQTHLCHRGDIGALSVFPQGKNVFSHRRVRFFRIVQGERVLIPVVCSNVRRRTLLDTEAVGKSLRRHVPQIDGIAVSFRFPVRIGMEDDGNRLFPITFVLAVRHGFAVHAEDMSGTYRLVGFFYMCVAGSQCPGYEESRHYLARFSDNVLFHLSLIL